MTQHSHILQQAHLPEECPRCAAVWTALEVVDPYLDLETEFQVAKTLREDYGDREMLTHLTATMEKAQKVKWQIMGA